LSLLPRRGATSVIAHPSFRPLRRFLDRDLLEQSVAERLAKAVIAAGFLWLAIWWALS
jgi:hypothetical protein